MLNVTIDIGNADDARIAATMFAALANAYGVPGPYATGITEVQPLAPRPRGRPPKNDAKPDPAEAYANLGGTLPAEDAAGKPLVMTEADAETLISSVPLVAPNVAETESVVEQPDLDTPSGMSAANARTDAEILDAARAVARAKGAIWLRAWLTDTRKDKLSDFAVADLLKVAAGVDAASYVSA